MADDSEEITRFIILILLLKVHMIYKYLFTFQNKFMKRPTANVFTFKFEIFLLIKYKLLLVCRA